MRILLDECLPHRLRTALFEQDIMTTSYMGWKGLKNGVLLRVAEDAGIEVLLTADGNLTYQQNWLNRRIAVITLSGNHWPAIEKKLPEIVRALSLAVPGSFQFVDIGGDEI